MSEEPAEAEEIFQYELVKILRKMNKSLESININLEHIRKKMTEEEGIHP